MFLKKVLLYIYMQININNQIRQSNYQVKGNKDSKLSESGQKTKRKKKTSHCIALDLIMSGVA